MSGASKLTLFVEAFLMTIALSITLGSLQYAGNQRTVALVIGVPTIGLLALLMIAEATPRLSRATRAFGVDSDAAPGDAEGAAESRTGQADAGAASGATPQAGQADAGAWRRVWTVYAWLLFYFAAMFVAGYYVATPLFLALFFVRESGLTLPRAAGVTLLTSAAFYLLFEMLLNIPLWTGALPLIVPDLLGGGRIPPLN